MTAAAVLALAPDPALPGRDTLLDGGAMAERLAPLLRAEGPLERCRRVLVRYDPGQRLAVLYGIRAGGAEHRVVASAYADEARVPPGFAHDRELGAVLWTFPDDPRLGGLTSIVDWSQTPGALLGRGGVRAQLAGYVPEHRAVARFFPWRPAFSTFSMYATASGTWHAVPPMSTSTPSAPTSRASWIAPSFCRLSIIRSTTPTL